MRILSLVMQLQLIRDRELSYVQATRAKEITRFFIDKNEAGDKLKGIARRMEQSREKELATEIAKKAEREKGRGFSW